MAEFQDVNPVKADLTRRFESLGAVAFGEFETAAAQLSQRLRLAVNVTLPKEGSSEDLIIEVPMGDPQALNADYAEILLEHFNPLTKRPITHRFTDEDKAREWLNVTLERGQYSQIKVQLHYSNSE